MKIAHINGGNEFGGGLSHIISLLKELIKEDEADLIVFEEGPVAEAARKEGIPVYVFEQRSRYDLSVLFRVRKFINNRHYDIIHTHGPRANTLVSFVKPFIRTNWMMTVHSHPELDFSDRGIKGKVFEKMHLQTFKKSDGIIAVSNEIKEALQTFGVSEKRVRVIHNGIRFSEKPPRDIKKQRMIFTLVTVGRLTKVKGYSILMEALKASGFKEWQWIICGDGEEMARLKLLGQEYKLSSHLTFKGWLASNDIRQELQKADILVLPSLSEGFPMIVLEAADERVPVIATDVGDVKEVLKDASMGWLIPAESEDKLRDALSQAYSLWEMNQLSIKGERLNAWATRFSIKQQTKAVRAFYLETVEKNRN